ncbi:hypothetical protein CTAYLR_003204 [Chrysophaeum taylorii]|uniref:Uncharacterized protein n=1 Tax=Chrysophaeum taylorii TaxID=2483200 RepID=A0AAD7XMW1_9STRA|nr:hypothetical protein CTAYLR_003204 [Chrysophaeum taylorii]
MRVISGLAVLSKYDLFLLDQYGVLHNGEALLPNVAEALEAMAATAKLVVLSNTSKRRHELLAELPKRGFREEWLAGAVCSGEECWRALERAPGTKALVLGWHRSGASYLEGTKFAPDSPEKCDVIVAHGPELLGDTPTGFMDSGDTQPYVDAFETCVRRGVPMYCANPDQVSVNPQGRALFMPGTLADLYRSMGGLVFEFGKPHTPHFRAAIDLVPGAAKVCHVGDSLKHDIAGAHAAGLDSLFVIESGVHAKALKNWRDDPETALANLNSHLGLPSNLRPTYCCATFTY